MHSLTAIDESPKVKSAELVDAQADSPPAWSTFEARRRRTLIFLLFAAVYVGYNLVMRWVESPLFNGDWYYFGGDPPPWYEYSYRWFLTLLPLAAWAGIVFFVLTRVSFVMKNGVVYRK